MNRCSYWNWRINLRHDQSRKLVGSPEVTSDEVTIFAPQWVEKGLELLGNSLKISPVKCYVYDTPPTAVFDPSLSTHFASFIVDNKPSLTDVQKLTRNQTRNTSGAISWSSWYAKEVPQDFIVAMKDLARQCVIVGRDLTTGYGGYGAPLVKKAGCAYLCDLAGLQFQQKHNSGRLVLVQKEPFKGLLDDLIFRSVVGEDQKTFDEVQSLSEAEGTRYVKSGAFGKTCYFDTLAYKKFVGADVVLSGRALSRLAKSNGDRLNFKFLKYGTGFFAGTFAGITNENILEGVLDGLETLFKEYETEVKGVIGAVEFPFFPAGDAKSHQRLKELKKHWGVDSQFSRDDALKATAKGLVTATTNCGDSHAAFGNEMGYGSVDAAIGANLKSKGNIFCPLLNCAMREEIIS